MASPRPHRVPSPIHHDRVQPRFEALHVSQRWQRPPGRDHRLLCYIATIVRSHDADGQPVSRRQVTLRQLFEGPEITVSCALYEGVTHGVSSPAGRRRSNRRVCVHLIPTAEALTGRPALPYWYDTASSSFRSPWTPNQAGSRCPRVVLPPSSYRTAVLGRIRSRANAHAPPTPDVWFRA